MDDNNNSIRTETQEQDVNISTDQLKSEQYQQPIEPIEIESQVTSQDVDNHQRKETISRIPRSEAQSTFNEACINFYKGSMGSGVLATPYAISQGGWGLGLVMFSIVPILILCTTQMLVRIVEEDLKRPKIGLSEVTSLLLSDKAVTWMKIFLIILQWGCCASYILFFMQFFEYAFYNSLQISFLHQLIYLCLALCLILPMTLIDNIAVFAKYSVLASIITVVVLIAVIIYSLVNLGSNEYLTQQQEQNIVTWKYLPLQAGISLFAFEGIGLVFSIRSSMKDEKQFPRVINTCCIWIVIQNLIVGLVSSFSFGAATQQIVLLSLKRSWISSFFQILYSLALLISFPLQLLPAFHQLEKMDILKKFIETNASGYVMRRTLIRAVQVLLIAGLAISIPQFAILLSFIGGLAGAVLQFWFPMMIYVKNRWNKDKLSSKVPFMTASIIGIIFGVIATIDSLVLSFQ